MKVRNNILDPNLVFHDLNRTIVGREGNSWEVVEYQEVGDDYWEENRRRREASKSFPIGDFHPYVRCPRHIWSAAKAYAPALAPYMDRPPAGGEAGREFANQIMRVLRLMGEDRCIITHVERF